MTARNSIGRIILNSLSYAGWQIATVVAMSLIAILPAFSRADDAATPQIDEPSTEQSTPAENKAPAEEKAPAADSAADPELTDELPVASDEAAKSTETPAVAAPTASATSSEVTDDDIRVAELKAREAEVAFINAQLKLEQLRSQRKIALLQQQLKQAEEALAAVGPKDETGDGFIHKWLVLGPIKVDEKVSNHDEESNKELLDRHYTPPLSSPKAGDEVEIDNAQFSWQAVENEEYFVELSKVAEDAGADPEHAAYLGLVYVTASEEVDGVRLVVGSDDDCAWRLNGEEVVRFYGGRGIDKDQDEAAELTLKKGVNVLSFTVLNGEGPSAAAARFIDDDGNAVKGLKFSTEPPTEQITLTDPAAAASSDNANATK